MHHHPTIERSSSNNFSKTWRKKFKEKCLWKRRWWYCVKLKPDVRRVCGPHASTHIVCLCEHQAVIFHPIDPFKCVLLISLQIDTFHITYHLALNMRLFSFYFIIMSESPLHKPSVSVTLHLVQCALWLIQCGWLLSMHHGINLFWSICYFISFFKPNAMEIIAFNQHQCLILFRHFEETWNLWHTTQTLTRTTCRWWKNGTAKSGQIRTRKKWTP